jgi:hypothetical protein
LVLLLLQLQLLLKVLQRMLEQLLELLGFLLGRLAGWLEHPQPSVSAFRAGDFTKSARGWRRAFLFGGGPSAAPPCFGRFFPLAGCKMGCAGFFTEGCPAAPPDHARFVPLRAPPSLVFAFGCRAECSRS